MKKIAIVYYGNSTFVEQDYNILSKHFEVRRVQFTGIKNIYDIYKATKWAGVNFCQFADVWSFFAVLFSKIFKKKSVVVVSGYDVACESQINYGMCTKSKLRQWMSRFTLNKCNLLLAVSDNIRKDCYKYLKYPRDIFVVNRGHDSEKFKADVNKFKHSILAVVVSGRENIIKLKGLDTFVKAAKAMPGTEFVIVGVDDKDRVELRNTPSSYDIRILGKCTQQELLQWYQYAKVYCQLSLREGLPNSLCEAMLCECVPVGSDCEGVANVIGDTGFCVPYGNVEATVDAIKKALRCDELGKEARKRICGLYPLEKREKYLLELIQFLKSGKKK